MVFFIISCISLILMYKSLHLKPLPPWAHDMPLITPWFWKDLSFFCITKSVNNSLMSSFRNPFSLRMSPLKNTCSSKVESEMEMSVLDLPELVLESILERLPPDALCKMAGVCSSFRDRCMSDHLWRRHLEQKWGRIIGPAAYREWQWHITSGNNLNSLEGGTGRGFLDSLFRLWPLSLVRSIFMYDSKRKSPVPVDSIMSWYLALESGEFAFPAQVYNRENGHVGFLLSCYDSLLCYDSCTDTFEARYQPHGRRAVVVERGITWDRIRAPLLDSSPHELYTSDCLSDLRPGDHFEIQWRRNKDFPYGWWYGVVGHLESCDGNISYCTCHVSDNVVLEFNQYAPGSRWRCKTIDRRDHREEGNEADGFYGGIRKLHNNEEISTWRRLWPAESLLE